MLETAIGVGITVNLLLTEVFGLASAGLVVPGYLALYLSQPWRLVATAVVALATWAIVRFGLERLLILYGRRRFGVTILTGFILNIASLRLLGDIPVAGFDLRAIGFIVPGLIANQALAQGVWPTLVLTALAAAIVRIVLVTVGGWMP
jgi:poly-gamma-glutamate biosynthesis protein PgsC/CapC